MLSRVADAVYWSGRYIERAENTARFIDVNLQMSLDAPAAFSEQWQPLVAITGNLEAFEQRYESPDRESVIQFLTFDAENPSSIISCLSLARENARSVREVISSETWEQINRFYLLVAGRAADRRAQNDSHRFFDEVKLNSHLVAGVADHTMSHGKAWHFLQLGRLLERADNTTRLLDVKYYLLLPTVEHVGGSIDEMQWSILLRSASALEMYRKRFGRISPEQVVDFLILNDEFPRAVLFCLAQAEESLHAISGTRPGGFNNLAERRLGQLCSDLAYAHVYDIIASGLHEYLDGLQAKLSGVGEAIADTFFAMRPTSSVKAGGKAGDDVLFGDQGQRRAGGYRGYAGDHGQ